MQPWTEFVELHQLSNHSCGRSIKTIRFFGASKTF